MLESKLQSRTDTWFRDFANFTAEKVGAPSSFALGVLLILVWIVSGPFFHFSDTWQLVIHNHNFSDGLPHSEHPNARHEDNASQIG